MSQLRAYLTRFSVIEGVLWNTYLVKVDTYFHCSSLSFLVAFWKVLQRMWGVFNNSPKKLAKEMFDSLIWNGGGGGSNRISTCKMSPMMSLLSRLVLSNKMTWLIGLTLVAVLEALKCIFVVMYLCVGVCDCVCPPLWPITCWPMQCS